MKQRLHVICFNRIEEDGMTEKTLSRGNSGFSLVEMLIALLILSISILALTSITLTAIQANLGNDSRNAAVRLTAEITEDLFIVPFDSLVSTTAPQTRTVKLRGVDKTFNVEWAVTSTTATLKQIVIKVTYKIKGESFTNQSVVYRPSET